MTTPSSPLIDDDLKKQLQDVLGKLERDVSILSVYDDAYAGCDEMRDFLDVIASLSPHVHVRHLTPGEDPALEKEMEAHLLPVAALYHPDGKPLGVRFHGVPGGQELNSFILAIYNYAGPGQALEEAQREAIAAITTPADIKICVALSCHHCPATVTACQRVAILNPHITASMVDARLYPDLVAKYKIERVPCVVLNDTDVHVGSKTIEKICDLLR